MSKRDKIVYLDFGTSAAKVYQTQAEKGAILSFPKMETNYDAINQEGYDWLIKEITGKEDTNLPPSKYISWLTENSKFQVVDFTDRVINFNHFYDQYGIHLSLFHKKNRPTILRHYREDDGVASYWIIGNFRELEKNSPDMTARLVKNGAYVFLTHTDKERRKRIFKV